MMRALLVGYGKMGRLIAHLAPHYNIAISGVVSPRMSLETAILPERCAGYTSLTQEAIDGCDVAIDFATPRDICERIRLLAAQQKPIVVGTTGWDRDFAAAEKIVHEHKSALLYSPNFSLGVALFSRLVDYAATLFSPFEEYDVGMMETHHRLKQDAPSGTALLLAEKVMQHYPKHALADELQKAKALSTSTFHLSSHRSGYHPGTHELLFDSPEDTITLTHRARNREGFARGALTASYWLIEKKGVYTLDDMIEEKLTTKRAS